MPEVFVLNLNVGVNLTPRAFPNSEFFSIFCFKVQNFDFFVYLDLNEFMHVEGSCML
jgi:hypothetical protein